MNDRVDDKILQLVSHAQPHTKVKNFFIQKLRLLNGANSTGKTEFSPEKDVIKIKKSLSCKEFVKRIRGGWRYCCF